MTRLDFAKLIIGGRDFEVKSRYFGECIVINGEDYIVLYDETKAPAVELARWRKELFTNYLDYLVNSSKRGNLNSAESLAINDECSILDKIFNFIGADI